MMRSLLRGGWLTPVVVGLLTVAVQADEYRAFWVDAWGAGIRSQAEVETLLGRVGDPTRRGRIRDANCNTVVIQVRRRADVCYPSAMGEPYFSGLSPSNFNALKAAIDAAHDTTGGKQRIEVHAWIVTFATASAGATPSPVYFAHSNPNDPENYWVTLDSSGQETEDKALDPGHPKCLEYLTNVCMDLVNNYDIDGIHYDYIRFTGSTQGYNPTSVARYNERYGLTGKPSSSSEQFKQWRRDQVTALVRRVYAHVQASKPHVKVSGSFVTWNPSPSNSTRAAFMNTRPYYDVYSDWDAWIQEGIIDVAFPMTYYNWASLPNDYTRWMNFEKDRKGNRHMVIGPGIYLNSLNNAILEILRTRDLSPAGNAAHGFCGYSYRVPYNGGNWDSFASNLVAQVTPTPTNIPDAPWKSNPTTGHIMGTVTHAGTGTWADHAVVSITGPQNRSMYVDGTGFYAFIDLPPGTYNITASKPGYASAISSATVAIGEMTGNMYVRNLVLGGAGPVISNVQVANITNNSATVTWTTNVPASSRVEYGLTAGYGLLSPLLPGPTTSHSVTLTGLSPKTLYHFRVISSDADGTNMSGDFTFSTSGPPTLSNIVASPTATTATITWTTDTPSNSRVFYGPTAGYGSQSPLDPSEVTSHSVTITGLSPETLYHFKVVSANPYGSAESGDLTFTTTQLMTEIVVDNLDPGWTNTSPSGTWTVGSVAEVPKIGPNYLYTAVTGAPENPPTRSCRWTPNLPVTGFYDVYVFYQIGANRTSGAPFTVVYDGGSLVSVQDQYSAQPNQGGWFLIGENLPFKAGTSGYVELGNNTPTNDTRLVSADAARWVLKTTDISPPGTPIVTDDGTYTASRTTLHAQWEAEDAESGIAKYEYRIVQVGGGVIRDWTDVGTSTEVTAAGLTLTLGRTYIFEVRATNGENLVSAVGASDGITVFPFDANGDEHVDEHDVDLFVQCLSGSDVPYPVGPGLDCERFDLEADGDVDMTDFALFQRCLSGPAPIDPSCIE